VTWVKICGIRTLDEADVCLKVGVDALGINFWPSSRRYCDEQAALQLVKHIGDAALVVGVFVNSSVDEVQRIRDTVGLGCVQLHGDETPEALTALLPHAYKALRAADKSIEELAQTYPGEYLLVDAYIPGEAGGTGQTWDWRLAAPLARQRKLVLAGGLTPENVAYALAQVKPFAVDVASGVENAHGMKDPRRVAAFVEAVRGADSR